MAPSLKSAGTWVIGTALDQTLTIPTGGGSPAEGDRIYVFATWKAFGTTAFCENADENPWPEITEFADGSVAPGAGTGSMKVGAWYHDVQASDSDTQVGLNFSVAPVPSAAVVMVWQKGAGEAWDTPTFVTKAATVFTTTSQTEAASADLGTVLDGAVILCLIGIRDDSATFTRPTTGISDDGSPALTWNGNHVESPGTHASSTTSNDIAADLGHRFVTTGGSNVRLQATCTLSAAETGAILWVHQGVSAAAATGTIASTLARALANLTGQMEPAGDVVSSMARALATLSGAQEQSGAAISTMRPVGASMSGLQTIEGPLAATIPRSVYTAQGEQEITGLASPALRAGLFSGAGDVPEPPPAGDIVSTMARAVAAAAGTQEQLGDIASAIRPAVYTGQGIQIVSGVQSSTLARALMAASGVMVPTGIIVSTLRPALFIGIEGVIEPTGSMSAATRRAAFAGAGIQEQIATVASVLARTQFAGQGAQIFLAAMASTLEEAGFLGAGQQPTQGQIAAALRALIFAGLELPPEPTQIVRLPGTRRVRLDEGGQTVRLDGVLRVRLPGE